MTDRSYAPKLALVLAVAAVTACAGHEADDEVGPDASHAAVTTATDADMQRHDERERTAQSASELGDVADAAAPLRKTDSKSTASGDRMSAGRAASTPGLLRSVPSFKAQAQSVAPAPDPRVVDEPQDRENYAHVAANPVHRVAEDPVSTLSIDVDTGSYANVRRFLNDGRLPPQDAVRVEEMINYFAYDYPLPERGAAPFSVSTELAPTPWNDKTVLMQVGIRGYEVPADKRAPANLVFLVDVSGSMNDADKLPLLKNAFRLFTGQLDSRDRVSIVVYAGSSGVVLEPTAGDDHAVIMDALKRLGAGGSTNGAAGIRQAYALARSVMVDGGINRVVLATDGDFNVGTVNFEALIDLVEQNRDSGVSLTTLGFGTGNYNDHLMERLADAGNGNYAYIDTLNEARKVLVEELTSTLQTIASDVKIQLEFNPATVAEYRLIGYENRLLNREDFNNDRVDAGEIGAGHTVTALYELALTGSAGTLVDPLRYADLDNPRGNRGELAFLKLRYKAPGSDSSTLLEVPVRSDSILRAADTSASYRFAAAVAAFGQRLAGSTHIGDYRYGRIADLALAGRGDDRFGYRAEFVSLVGLAAALDGQDDRPVRISGGQ